MPGFPIDVHLSEHGLLDSIADDVRRGLSAPQKFLLPKFLYDAEGSLLFEQVTEAPEYYPTRTELSILTTIATEVMERVAPKEMVELGSGSSTKTRMLLDAGYDAKTLTRYVPFDVSQTIVESACVELEQRYPDMQLHGVIGDFERHLGLVPPAVGKRLVLFIGSTIGNLEPADRLALLREIRKMLALGDYLLLGMDQIKDVAVLEAAYNDAGGVTAAFNLNVLKAINNALHADFNVDEFRHRSHYNHDLDRIEMHLYAQSAQTVHITDLGMTVEIAKGESIWTESSHKFTQTTATAMLQEAGMKLDTWYTDPLRYFGLALATTA
jgi:L-histidine N-alpha-methyltransferase